MTATDQSIRIILTGEARGMTEAGAQAERALKGVDKAAEGMRTSLQRSAAATMSQQRQLALVGPQITDIAVGLATGQRPLMVMLQQGGQLRDLFGSLSGAARAVAAGVAAMVTPFTIAAGTVTALVAAAMEAESRVNALGRAMTQGGHAAGVTASGFEQLVGRVADAANVSQSSARDLGLAFVASGRVSGEALDVFTEVAARIQRASGESAEAVTKDLLAMAKGVTDWAIEHNRQWHFATAGQIDYIRELEATRGAQAAMTETGRLLNQHLDEQTSKVRGLAAAWANYKKWASDFWSGFAGVFAGQTLDQKIASTTADLEKAEAAIARGDTHFKTLRDQLARDLADLQIERRDATVRAANRAIFARDQQTEIDKRAEAAKAKTRTHKTKVPRPEIDRDPIGSLITRLTQKEAAEEERRAQAAQREAERQLEAERRAHESRVDQMADFATQLIQQTEAMNIGLMTDDRARGLAQIELDRKVMQQRLAEWQSAGVDITAAQTELNANILARQRVLNEQLKPEWQRMLDGWRDTTRLMTDTYNSAMGRMLAEGESAWIQMARDGKLSVSGLVNVIIEEFARLQYRQLIAPLLADGTNSLLGMMGLPSSSSGGMDAHVQEFNAKLKASGDAAGAQAGQLNSLTGMLGRFGDVVLSAAQAVVMLASNAGGSGGGNLFGSLFGSLENSNFFGDLLGISFASGGMHRGGLRLVGEKGPELEVTGPARIWNADQTRDMLASSGGNVNVTVNSPLVVQGGGDTDRARLSQMLDARDARLRAQIVDELSRPGRPAYGAARQ